MTILSDSFGMLNGGYCVKPQQYRYFMDFPVAVVKGGYQKEFKIREDIQYITEFNPISIYIVYLFRFIQLNLRGVSVHAGTKSDWADCRPR